LNYARKLINKIRHLYYFSPDFLSRIVVSSGCRLLISRPAIYRALQLHAASHAAGKPDLKYDVSLCRDLADECSRVLFRVWQGSAESFRSAGYPGFGGSIKLAAYWAHARYIEETRRYIRDFHASVAASSTHLF